MTGKEETILVQGKRIQLFTGGGGPPLLYLHGAGTYWWMPVHDRLAARRRVFLPVHPGFGASEGYDVIEDVEDLVFHTVDVLDALGLDRVDVVGLSLGGWLAAELAHRHPSRVGHLVLVDAAGTRVPGVERGDSFLSTPAKARQLLFGEPRVGAGAHARTGRSACGPRRSGAARSRGRRPVHLAPASHAPQAHREGSGASRRQPSWCGVRRIG